MTQHQERAHRYRITSSESIDARRAGSQQASKAAMIRSVMMLVRVIVRNHITRR
jgi:hypothetical protein